MSQGGGASAQHAYCTPISQAEAQPGDLAFYPDASHVGIVVGQRKDSKLLVCHCFGGQNDEAATEFVINGFTDSGRPDFLIRFTKQKLAQHLLDRECRASSNV